MSLSPPVATILAGAGGTLLAALLVATIRMLVRVSRQVGEQHADWYGEAARPGFDRRPGIPERIQAIESQLKPNGGASVRDAISRIENAQQTVVVQHGELLRQYNDLARKFDDHLQRTAGLEQQVRNALPRIIDGDSEVR